MGTAGFSVRMRFDGSPVRQILIGNSQDRGARNYQEDSFGFTSLGKSETAKNGFMAIVADGMGGLSCGDKISSYVVSAMLEMRKQVNDMVPVHIRFNQMITSMNQAVVGSGTGGGSTVSAVLCCTKGLFWCSCGDSRIYLCRKGSLIQLSEDRDYMRDLLNMVIEDDISYYDADNDEQKDSLAQYIGADKELYPDCNIRPLVPAIGDKLLICSDGVYNALTPQELMIALSSDAQTAADEIKQKINTKNYPTQDNFTSVILEFKC